MCFVKDSHFKTACASPSLPSSGLTWVLGRASLVGFYLQFLKYQEEPSVQAALLWDNDIKCVQLFLSVF